MTLITTARHPSHPGVREVPVETAAQMLEELRRELPTAEVLVMAAAVADYRPVRVEPQKLRRESAARLVLELERNVDILAEIAALPAAGRIFRVGFAAEDSDLESRALQKLDRKGLDAIVANDISRSDSGFGSDDNAGVAFFKDGERVELSLTSKREMADRVWDLIRRRLG